MSRQERSKRCAAQQGIWALRSYSHPTVTSHMIGPPHCGRLYDRATPLWSAIRSNHPAACGSAYRRVLVMGTERRRCASIADLCGVCTACVQCVHAVHTCMHACARTWRLRLRSCALPVHAVRAVRTVHAAHACVPWIASVRACMHAVRVQCVCSACVQYVQCVCAVRVCGQTCGRACTCVHGSMHACMHASDQANERACAGAYIRTLACASVHACERTSEHVCVRACVSACVRACIDACASATARLRAASFSY